MKRIKTIFFAAAAAAICASCQRPFPVASPADESGISSCPWLTKDNQGNFLLSWIHQDSTGSNGIMYYAVSEDGGRTFGPPRKILSSAGAEPHGENMPKMIMTESGRLIAVFGVSAPSPGNEYTGKIYFTVSVNNGRTWSDAAPLTRDTGSFDQRYFDLAPLPGGGAGITWLNNSEPQGSTLYYAATGGNGGFENAKIIGMHTCQCCRTDLFTDKRGYLHVAYRDIINDSIRDMVYSVSADTGKTFSAPVRISPDNWVVNGCPHTGPDMTANSNGLHFVWYTMGGGGGVYYGHSSDNGKTFSPRETVSANPSAKHPQITALPGGNLAIVWDENTKEKEHFYRRIGLQVRDPRGRPLKTAFITPGGEDAAFAVIRPVDKETVIVAYTARINEREKVFYRRVDLNKPGE